MITQLRALKKYWHAPVRDAAKSALANWKDQVATISSASSAGIATASAFRAPHNGHGTDVSSAVRSGIPTRPPSLEPRLWSEVNGNNLLSSCTLQLLLLEVFVVNANALKKTAHFLFCFQYKSTHRQERDAPTVLTSFMSPCMSNAMLLDLQAIQRAPAARHCGGLPNLRARDAVCPHEYSTAAVQGRWSRDAPAGAAR